MSNTPVRKGHPKALWILFMTEMWERFGYYLMVGIFFLYLIDPRRHGGKGFDATAAADVVGSYIALVYLTPFIGGLIADRFLGYRKAIIIGGALMACGYFGLALPGDGSMYVSLLCIIVGNGFFKPNISTLLGNIYNAEDLKPKKDVAYNIFYMGINIGAFFCNFVAAYLRNYYGWGYAFAAAGVGMVIALIVFISMMKHVKDGDVVKPVQKEDMPMSKMFLYVFAPAIAAGIIGWNFHKLIGSYLFHTVTNDAFFFACIPIIIFYLGLYFKATREDKRGLGALLSFFAVSIVFWVIYNQNSTALTIWADSYTNRHMPAAGVKWTKPFGMLQLDSSDVHTVTKIDEHFVAQLDAKGNTQEVQGIDPYLQNLNKAEWPKPGEKENLISPELYQSANPLYIVILTPLVLGFFGFMKRRKLELNTPMKIAIGMIIAGLSSLTMYFAVKSTNIYVDKTSMIWLLSTYGIFSVGELLISPIGLSMVSKLAPARLTALMMGAWFLINSMAGKISGMMGSYWDKFEDKGNYFLILFFSALASAAIMFFMVKWLAAVVREKTGSN
ncbi:MAG TPA: peptide MFS transporter [Bacteroidia bacterium]|jgi:POT family proton-dependent oligopeptide transporter|nr:peptide MFS transporter [Bacteroidia bacterium]